MQLSLSAILRTNSRKFRLSALLLLSPLFFYGQSLTGLWIGAVSNDSTTVRKDQSFEIALTEYRGKVYGYSRSEFIVDDVLYYVVKRVKGTINGDVCEVSDDEIIAYNFPTRIDKGVKVTSIFRRNETDNAWYLDGTWKTNKTKNYYSVTGKISLAEEKDLSASKIFPHLEELKIADEVAFYKERKEGAPIVKLAKPEMDNKASLINPAVSDQSLAFPQRRNDATIATVPRQDVMGNIVIADPIEKEKKIGGTYTPVTESAISQEKAMALKTKPDNIPVASESITNLNRPAIPAAVPAETKETEAIATDVAAVPPKLNGTDIKPAYTNPDIHQSTELATNAKPSSTKTPERPVADPVKNNPSAESITNNKSQITNQTASQTKPAEPAYTGPDYSEDIVVTRKPAQQVSAPVVKQTQNDQAKSFSTINKEKKDKPIAIKPIPRVNTTVAQRNGAAAEINGRRTEVSQVVNFTSDSLQIALYDNGQIDGDTVSVLMNGEVILSKQGLKAAAIRHTIYLTGEDKDEFHLVLYAENLGTYPPNTGLLVVRDGDDVYNLRFSSDFQKNTGIIFRRKE